MKGTVAPSFINCKVFVIDFSGRLELVRMYVSISFSFFFKPPKLGKSRRNKRGNRFIYHSGKVKNNKKI